MSNTESNKNSIKVINMNLIMDELKCSICLDYFNNPRTLNCQHSFCTDCLKPLAKERLFSCPQCRASTFCDSVEKIAKNNLLSNLISNLNDSAKSPACPHCKQIKELTMCDHCSQLFCHKCSDDHIDSVFQKLDKKISAIQSLPKMVDNLKQTIEKSQAETFNKMLNQIDTIQSHIFSLWHTRKLQLMDEMNRYFKLKKNDLELIEFRLKFLSTSISELDMKKEKLEKELEKNPYESKLMKDLVNFETEIVQMENQFNGALINVDSNTHELKLKYNELDNIAMFKRIMDNVSIITTSKKDEKFLNTQEPTNDVEIKDIFGKSIMVKLSSDTQEATIRGLKEILKGLLCVDKNQIQLLDTKGKVLDDNLELIIRNGKVFCKRDNLVLQENEPESSADKELKMMVYITRLN